MPRIDSKTSVGWWWGRLSSSDPSYSLWRPIALEVTARWMRISFIFCNMWLSRMSRKGCLVFINIVHKQLHTHELWALQAVPRDAYRGKIIIEDGRWITRWKLWFGLHEICWPFNGRSCLHWMMVTGITAMCMITCFGYTKALCKHRKNSTWKDHNLESSCHWWN